MTDHLTESELYKELGVLTKKRDEWEASIPYVSSLLDSSSIKIRAKALWLLGEMGLAFPISIEAHVPAIATFCDSSYGGKKGCYHRRIGILYLWYW